MKIDGSVSSIPRDVSCHPFHERCLRIGASCSLYFGVLNVMIGLRFNETEALVCTQFHLMYSIFNIIQLVSELYCLEKVGSLA